MSAAPSASPATASQRMCASQVQTYRHAARGLPEASMPHMKTQASQPPMMASQRRS